jgi:phage-related protein
MAEKPVIVPVELQVTDISTDAVSLSDVQKSVNSKLSKIQKSIGKVFSGIDTSKMNKAIINSMSAVEKSVDNALTAQSKFNQAVIKAGKSSDVYKADIEEVNKEISLVKSQLKDLDDMGLGHAVDKYRDGLKAQLAELEEYKTLIDPLDYIKTASQDSLVEAADRYRKVEDAISQVNEQSETFNASIENNNISDEYQELYKQAQSLYKSLTDIDEKSKKMAAVGATDKSWDTILYDTEKVSDELKPIIQTLREMVKTGSAFRFDAAEDEIKQLKSELKEMSRGRFMLTGGASSVAGGPRELGSIGTRAIEAKIKKQEQDPYTDTYKEQVSAAEKLAKTAQTIIDKYNKAVALGNISEKQFKSMEYDAQQLADKIWNIGVELTDLISSGKAFKLGSGSSDEFTTTITKLHEVINTLGDVKNPVQEVEEPVQTTNGFMQSLAASATKVAKIIGTGFKNSAKVVSGVATGFEKVHSAVNGLVKGFKSVVSRIKVFGKIGQKTSTDMTKSWDKLKRNLLMYVAGFRSAYYAIKKLRSIFITAFKELANQSDEVNTQLSDFVMYINKLKGSIATAFQPIVSVVIPILNTLMSKLSETMETLGKFFATFTGQNYIYKATEDQYDYAASLDNTSQKLGEYDKLNVINDNKQLDVTYEKAEIEGTASDFATAVKNAWANQDFTSIGDIIQDKLVSVLDSVATNILPKLSNFINKLVTSVSTLIEGLDFSELGTKVANGITSTLSDGGISNIGGMIGSLIGGTNTFIDSLLSSIDWDVFGDKLAIAVSNFIDNFNIQAFIGRLEGLATGVIEIIKDLIHNIDWSSVYDDIKEGIDSLLASIQKSLEGTPIGNFVGSIRNTIEKLWPILEKVFGIVSDIVVAIEPLVSEITPVITDVLGTLVDTLGPVVVSLIEQLSPILKEIILEVLPALQQLIIELQPAFQVIVDRVLPFIVKLLTALMPIINAILDLVVSILGPIFELIAPLLTLIMDILDPILDALTPLLTMIGSLITNVAALIKPILEIISPLLSLLSDALTPITNVLSYILENVLTGLSNAISFISNLIAGIVNGVLNALLTAIRAISSAAKTMAVAFQTAFTKIKNIVSTTWGGIKTALNSILSGVEKVVNGVITAINGMIGMLNKIQFTVPDWVPGMGGKTFGFNIKQVSTVNIPRLAQGAVIPPNKEFLAMLGDQSSGTNIEAPLDTIKQALAEVLSQFGSVNRDPIVLQLDGKTIAKVVWAQQEKRYKQTGKVSAY